MEVYVGSALAVSAELLRRRAVLGVDAGSPPGPTRPPRAHAQAEHLRQAPAVHRLGHDDRLSPGRVAGRPPVVRPRDHAQHLRSVRRQPRRRRRRPERALSTTTWTTDLCSPTTSATRTPTASRTTTSHTAACSRATGPVATQPRRSFHVGYTGTNVADADTDGDGVRDGADDTGSRRHPQPRRAQPHRRLGPLRRRGTLHAADDGHAGARSQEQPSERLRPREPVQPVPAVHGFREPARDIVNSDTGAPFDDSPNWYSLQ